MSKPRPVLVIWNDAGVTLAGDDIKPFRTMTLGWLVRKGKDGLVIATDYVESLGDHGEARHIIPLAMVSDYWFLDID